MCDTVLALGENGSFHLECPSRWFHQGLSGTVKSLFDNNAVASTYHLCLGFNGGFVFSYKDKSGRVQLTSRDIPQALNDWLYKKDSNGENARDFTGLNICLGPGGKAFFATDGKNFLWGDLPQEVTAQLQSLVKNGKFTDTPRIVCLGVENNYFLLTQGDMAKTGALRDIKNLILSPHKAGACAVVMASGFSAADGLPASAELELQAMTAAIRSDTEKQQHKLDVLDMERKARTIELNNMATRLADSQIRASARSLDYLNGNVYVCRYCHSSSCYC